MTTLSAQQRLVVNHSDGALLVVAGPGAGKTRVLTERVRRILSRGKEHFRVLALTFTNKAANEMRERLSDIEDIDKRAFIGTLHGFCMEVLQNRGHTIGLVDFPHIFESQEDRVRVLAEAVAREPELRGELQVMTARERERTLGRWLREIGELKNNLVLPEMVDEPATRRLYEAYDAELRASSAIDFDDLLLLAYRIFEEAPGISRFYRRQFKYICVDEAQDLNEAQYRVICALCGDEHRNVMFVGDPKQAIYVWNGADPNYMTLFERDFEAKRVSLLENYRSSKSVVAVAQALEGSYSIEGQLPVEGLVEIHSADDEKSEAAFVVEKIRQLRSEGHPDVEGPIELQRCAVLGRTRFVFGALQDALKAEGVDYHLKVKAGAIGLSSDLSEELNLALRVVANPHDRLHLGLIASKWGVKDDTNALRGELRAAGSDGIGFVRGVAARATEGSPELVLRAIEAMQISEDSFSLPPALRILEEASTAMDDDPRAGVLHDVQELSRSWDHYVRSRSGGGELSSFLAHLALGTSEQATGEGVALLTVHSAKGMEFDVVFAIGLCEGVFPDYRARGSGLDEERRNAFVAVTRSRRLLYLTYPRVRMMPWGDLRVQQASRFLRQIEAACPGIVSR